MKDLSIVSAPGDPFDHYFYKYGTPDEKRIISIERTPTISFSEADDIHSNMVRVTIEQKYY